MHDLKKNSLKYLIFQKEDKKKKDNQTMTRSVKSKQLFKIKVFWRVHGRGT